MKRWLTDEIILKRKTGVDKYNKPTFSEEKTIKGKIENTYRLIKKAQGEAEVLTAVIFVDVSEEIEIGDYVAGREVLSINPIKNHKGRPSFLEVLAK